MAAARGLCSSLAAPKDRHLSSASGVLHSTAKSGGAISSSSPARARFPIRGRECRAHGRRGRLRSAVRAASGDDDGGAADSAATKGRQLWRSELDSASSDFEPLDGATLERDIERFARKEEREKLSNRADRSDSEQASEQRGGVVRDVVDKVLVADFFFILFILAWLVAGLAEQAALRSSRLIDSWLPLWPLVFQPALGVFMAGAIVSAIAKKN